MKVYDFTNCPEVQSGHDKIDNLCEGTALIRIRYGDSAKNTLGTIHEILDPSLSFDAIIFEDDSGFRLLYLNGYERLWKSFTDEKYPDFQECYDFLYDQYKSDGKEVPEEVEKMLRKYFK